MKRPILMLYGIVTYALFNASFLYLAGFLQEFAVPKAINDGVLIPAYQALAINAGLVFLFGFFHSLMARQSFKDWWTQYVPVEAERSTYVLQSALFLGLAMWQWQPMPVTIWLVEGIYAYGFIALFVIGVTILLTSTFLIDHFELFGLKQVWFASSNRDVPDPTFKTPMLYKFVRHPMQLGVVITVFATPHMTVGHLVFASAMTIYIVIGLYFEERSLVAEFGDVYRQYQKTTPMLLPRVLPRRSGRSGMTPEISGARES